MNKHIFAIIVLAIASQINGMDGLYPHAYQCQSHHHKSNAYPYKVRMCRIGEAMSADDEYTHVPVYEAEDRAFDQFEDGKAPLVIGRRAFDRMQPQVLAALSEQVAKEAGPLCKLLAKPIDFAGNYLPEQNNFYWNRLKEQLANPQIACWEQKLNQFPALWQAIEKAALTANIFSSKKPDYFKQLLLPTIAKCTAAVFNSQSLFFCTELDKKDVTINQERNAKENAQAEFRAERIERDRLQTNLTNIQTQVDANTAALRNLEPQKETILRSMRQKLGQLFDSTQTPVVSYQMEDAGWAQSIANRLHNPPQELIQNGIQLLQDDNSNKLCDLIIKTSQVNPQNAKALILTVISHVRDATIQAYACPLLEKYKKSEKRNATLEEQKRKTQADLETAQKGKADAEGAAARLRTEKQVIANRFDTGLANLAQQNNQRKELARRMLGDLQQEIVPLQQELPTLRQLTDTQKIEIVALRNALAPRNQQ